MRHFKTRINNLTFLFNGKTQRFVGRSFLTDNAALAKRIESINLVYETEESKKEAKRIAKKAELEEAKRKEKEEAKRKKEAAPQEDTKK